MRMRYLATGLGMVLLLSGSAGWLYLQHPGLWERLEQRVAPTHPKTQAPTTDDNAPVGVTSIPDTALVEEAGETFALPPILPDWNWRPPAIPPRLRPVPPAHVARLMDSVYAQAETTLSYNPAYLKIAYPGGDVDPSFGVCTDVIIRAFRAKGVDLQQAVHEDMRRHFRKYPQKWGLRSPDTNIDHRRVLNLMTFFERKGKSLTPVSDNSNDYLAGDVVIWQLNEKQYHIGVVMEMRSYDEERPLIGHNINAGTRIEDVLFDWPIVGHYRYFEPEPTLQADLVTDRDNPTPASVLR
ncbi:MAG: DUF1287 domain-containing protein [Thiothrix sp.]|nr:DUF1287 domain-containing protein [Thiothrix sp.]HPE62167.1 DUF1287 domain-containing protein [Thiolinea sp.]